MSLSSVLSRLERETGLSFEPTDFPARLRIQKAVYLLNCLGDPNTKNYNFNLYVRGPYSPDLARAYYNITIDTVSKVPAAFIQDHRLRPVCEAVKRGNNFLEAASTLHLIARKNPGKPKDSIVNHVRWLKPELGRQLGEAWEFLEHEGLLTGSM